MFLFFLFCSVISDRYLMWSAIFKIPTLHREGGFLWSAWPWVQVNNLHTLPLQIISLMHSEEKHDILVKRMDSDRRCGRICFHGNALKALWQLLTSSELFLLFEVSLFYSLIFIGFKSHLSKLNSNRVAMDRENSLLHPPANICALLSLSVV